MIAALFAAVISFLAVAGVQSGVASAAEVTAELDDGLLRWLTRSRWWRQAPERPAEPNLSDITHDSLTVSWTAPDSLVFEISDYDVQYRAAGVSRYAEWSHDGAATETTITGLAEITEYEVRVRAESEAGEGIWSPSAVGATLLAPPRFLEGERADREVEENAPPDEAIGEPVAATISRGTLRYSLAGEDAEAFAIDRSNGQLRTREGAMYDHETRSRHLVEVEAAHADSGTARIAVRIVVLDVNEPPGQPVAPALSEFGSTGLRVDWDAPMNTGPAILDYDVEYRPQGTENFLDAGHEGTGTRATITGLAPQTLYEVRVRAINDEGVGAWSDTSQGRTPGSGGGGGQPPPPPPLRPDPAANVAPADQSAFDALFVPNFLSTRSYFIQFLPGGRFLESDRHRGDYTYANTGPNTGTVTQTYDDSSRYGGSCTVEVTFVSTREGTLRSTCAGGQSDTEDWRRDPMDTSSFNIEIIWRTSRGSAVDSAMQAAVARWENVIANNIDAVYISDSSEGIIDDIRIQVEVVAIDGPGGVLGSAGARWVRRSSGLPVISVIRLDDDDIGRISSALLHNLVLHEMAHALGFGNRWGGFLSDSAAGADPNSPLPDTHFTGAKAIAAFDAAGGTSYTGAKVPVENDSDAGQVDAHWRISVFGYGELMIGTFLSSAPRLPISAITVQSLADLGYAVNAGAADGYGLPSLNAGTTSALARSGTPDDRVPLRCVVMQPAPTDGVTLVELKTDPLR